MKSKQHNQSQMTIPQLTVYLALITAVLAESINKDQTKANNKQTVGIDPKYQNLEAYPQNKIIYESPQDMSFVFGKDSVKLEKTRDDKKPTARERIYWAMNFKYGADTVLASGSNADKKHAALNLNYAYDDFNAALKCKDGLNEFTDEELLAFHQVAKALGKPINKAAANARLDNIYVQMGMPNMKKSHRGTF